MLPRILRKRVRVTGTGGSCMPNLSSHTLSHPFPNPRAWEEEGGGHAPHRLVAPILRVFLCRETRWRCAFALPFMPWKSEREACDAGAMLCLVLPHLCNVSCVSRILSSGPPTPTLSIGLWTVCSKMTP